MQKERGGIEKAHDLPAVGNTVRTCNCWLIQPLTTANTVVRTAKTADPAASVLCRAPMV